MEINEFMEDLLDLSNKPSEERRLKQINFLINLITINLWKQW